MGTYVQLLINENILQLQVAVGDPLCVQRGYTRSDLLEDMPGGAFRKPADLHHVVPQAVPAASFVLPHTAMKFLDLQQHKILVSLRAL